MPAVSELEQYLQSPERRAEQAGISAIERIAGEVIGVFDSSFNQQTDAWPYRLVNEDELDPSREFSFSTTAMICFALGILVGRIEKSVLAPALSSPPEESLPGVADHKKNLTKNVNRAIEALCDESDHIDVEDKVRNRGMLEPIYHPPLTVSPTFGWDDPFTLAWLAEILNGNRKTKLQSFYARVKDRGWELVDAAAKNPAGPMLRVKKGEEVPHAFPLLRVLHLGQSLAQSDGKTLEACADLTLVREHFFERIHQRLSESQIADSAFDAADLVFSLEGWLLSSPFKPASALVDRAFAVLAQSQERTPYWRPLLPFKATAQGLILLPQSVEIANSLLRICGSPDLDRREYFSDHVELLERYASWILSRVFRGKVKDGPEFSGWESEHTYAQDQIHLWQTSQVLIFLYHYRAMFREHMAAKLLRLAGFVPNDPSKSRGLEYWRKETDGKEGYGEPFRLGPVGSPYRFYEGIGANFVRPRVKRSKRSKPFFSMLLYGPPGTGKSTIAKNLSKALGMPRITVTPSDFIAGGGEAVEARAKAIFEVLGAQRGLLVLFDEIDQLLLDRDSELYMRQQDLFKLLTPGMLTKLGNLSDQKSVVFVIATNYYERIDRAIKRVGRIDARYLVLPPDKERRRQHLSVELKGPWADISEEDRDRISRGTVFFTYRELSELAHQALLRSPDRSSHLPDVLDTLIKESPALTTLSSYVARLAEKGVEKPLEEIALLAALQLDAGESLVDEPAEIRSAIQLALDEHKVRDETIVDRLMKALPV